MAVSRERDQRVRAVAFLLSAEAGAITTQQVVVCRSGSL